VNPEPDAPAAWRGSLGDDLVLLSVWQGGGRIGSPHMTGIGLMGSELVRLATAGRIDITNGRISVTDPAPTGDAEADAALASLVSARRPPRAKDAYLERLAGAGVVSAEQQTRLGFIRVTRWRISDPARVADARARLDAIAYGSGQVDLTQAAFGGLAYAIGLAGGLYPGRDKRALRKRFERIAAGELTAGADAGTVPHSASSSVHAASHAAVSAAVHSATHAAVSAAHSAHGGAASGGGHGGH